jgi:hypothetical protein
MLGLEVHVKRKATEAAFLARVLDWMQIGVIVCRHVPTQRADTDR